MIELSKISVTLHFLERYVYRFQSNELDIIFNRITRLKRPTNQQFNRIKKSTHNANKKNVLVDGDLVVVIRNKTLITCWRLK